MWQVRVTVSRRATATSPSGLRLPKLILRHWTAHRSARSALLLVGSTPSLSRNVKNLSKCLSSAVARLRTSLSPGTPSASRLVVYRVLTGPGPVEGAPGGQDGTDDDRRSDDRGQEPERELRQAVPQRQVGTVVDIERGEHGDAGDAHPNDVTGVPRPVAPAVPVADGRGGERHGADDEQVVILPPAQRGQDRRGGEDHGDRPVEPAARPDVTLAALAR